MTFGTERRERMAKHQDLRVVVVGSGQTGLRTARLLDDRGHNVVIIERNPDRVRSVADEYIATIIEGDATDPNILQQADLQSTDVVAAMTDTMGTNFTVCTLAKEMNSDLKTVMRSFHEHSDYYRGHADELVTPEKAGARMAANAIEDGMRSLEPAAGDIELFEVRVAAGAPIAGKSLTDISLPTDSLVVSNVTEGAIVGGDTVMNPGDTFVVAVKPSVVDEVTRLFRG